jgi:hypothetical protein
MVQLDGLGAPKKKNDLIGSAELMEENVITCNFMFSW